MIAPFVTEAAVCGPSVEPTLGACGSVAHRQICPDLPRRLPILSGESQAHGQGAGLRARADVELAQDRGDVMRDRLLREEEALCDLAVAKALRHQSEHVEF